MTPRHLAGVPSGGESAPGKPRRQPLVKVGGGGDRKPLCGNNFPLSSNKPGAPQPCTPFSFASTDKARWQANRKPVNHLPLEVSAVSKARRNLGRWRFADVAIYFRHRHRHQGRRILAQSGTIRARRNVGSIWRGHARTVSHAAKLSSAPLADRWIALSAALANAAGRSIADNAARSWSVDGAAVGYRRDKLKALVLTDFSCASTQKPDSRQNENRDKPPWSS